MAFYQLDKITYGWYYSIQGHHMQSELFATAFRDRNIQVRFGLKVVLECWDVEILALWTNFYDMFTQRPLYDKIFEIFLAHFFSYQIQQDFL